MSASPKTSVLQPWNGRSARFDCGHSRLRQRVVVAGDSDKRRLLRPKQIATAERKLTALLASRKEKSQKARVADLHPTQWAGDEKVIARPSKKSSYPRLSSCSLRCRTLVESSVSARCQMFVQGRSPSWPSIPSDRLFVAAGASLFLRRHANKSKLACVPRA